MTQPNNAPTTQHGLTVNLLTAMTGVVDIYNLTIVGQYPWLLPSGLVIEQLQVPKTSSNTILWRDQTLPVYIAGDMPQTSLPYLLVIEGENSERMGLLIARPPELIQTKIASLRDATPELDRIDPKQVSEFCYEVVIWAEEKYQVPDIRKLFNHVTSKI